MAATLADVEAKTVGKPQGDVEAEALVDTLPDALSEVVAKTIAHALTCVQAKAPVKNEGDTLREWRLTQLSTHWSKVKLRHWSIRRLARFGKCRPRLLPTH